VGALVTDGVDAKLIGALRTALEAEGATLEIVAPTVGGVQMSDGQSLKADHKFSGGPSVLFDAVAILNAADATEALLPNAAVGDFIRDAFAHLKFIGYTQAAMPLFEKAGIADALDEACVPLTSPKSVDPFIAACRKLRFWKREETVTF
jgi:catalase